MVVVALPGDVVADVLAQLDVSPVHVRVLKDVPAENASWLVETSRGTAGVLRRYHDRATAPDIAYEHHLLIGLSEGGWTVPQPISELVHVQGRWYCLTRFVPGQAVTAETPAYRYQRGRDLAKLNVALRALATDAGQRPGWQAQHQGITVHRAIDWPRVLETFANHDPRLAAWAALAATTSQQEVARVGADRLPLTLVHGDFAEWNVHYDSEHQLTGVVDFGLSHLDSRPYELAIARTYRSPEAVAGYRDELRRQDWPLSERGPIARCRP
jgi:Ser/Thr protein kinase RdoA (MazF antagonist)